MPKAPHKQHNHPETLIKYGDDIVAWSQQQARFILGKNWKDLDLIHLADEILDVGKNEQRNFNSHMTNLVMYLLIWAYQPKRRCHSWENTIIRARGDIIEAISEAPSLKTSLAKEEWLCKIWKNECLDASSETNISLREFPQKPIWSLEKILQTGWFPDAMVKEK